MGRVGYFNKGTLSQENALCGGLIRAIGNDPIKGGPVALAGTKGNNTRVLQPGGIKGQATGGEG